MNLLFILHIKDEYIGGSKISAIDTANRMSENGNDIYIIADKNNFTIKKLLSKKVKLIHFQHHSIWPFSKSKLIYNVVKKSGIEKIVTFDRQSAYIASITSYFRKIPLVPIIPGGGKDQLPIEPIKIPTIVFSEENKKNLTELFNWSENFIEVVPARIDVSRFYSDRKLESRENNIAFISRINASKRESFTHFLNEVNNMNNEIQSLFEIEVVGDGDDLVEWKEMANSMNIKINFLGQKKVTGEFLADYRYIVGQGRVVLEAISSGCVALICGNEGYRGLVNGENFSDYSKTNFTGRFMFSLNSLENDISTSSINTEKLYSEVYKNYDIHILSNKIIEHNSSVSMYTILVSYLKILKSKMIDKKSNRF